MENISCAAEMKIAIREKQFELEIQGQMLKEDFFTVYESLKPVSLIKSTLNDITSSPYLLENMSGAILGIISGYISKKIAVGASHNLFRKIMGAVLQFGVTNLVSQHPDALKSAGEYIIEKLFRKNEYNTEEK